ncbi:MAG: hypothetical protein H0U62_09915 [Actinobacteria bacterium]|nr:hypothetical protein [Actinomycetota bacterium]
MDESPAAVAEAPERSGAVRSVTSIVGALGWRQAAEVLEVMVELQVEGEHRDLPPELDLAAYRTIQQGLTNALRHSGAQHARVLLRYGHGRLDITVDDDGRGLRPTQTAGHGLVGLQERAALYGGTVHLAPGDHGGVRLAASLPVQEAR